MSLHFTSLHFTLMISATYKFVYICTAHENYISLTRTSKAAMSKLEFTAKEGNLFHSLNLKMLVLAKGTLMCFLCIWQECLEGWDRLFVGMFTCWLSPWLKRHTCVRWLHLCGLLGVSSPVSIGDV